MKTHLNLGTTDLEASVAFYSLLLNEAPVKRLTDYALFVTENPGLELALDVRSTVLPGNDVHYGICVESEADVEGAVARLQNASLPTKIERDETCCYARQTKVWAADPDGRPWEIYTVHEETQARDDENTSCCADEAGERACCSA